MLRIGWIDYANCTPIFSTLIRHFDCGRYTFVRGVPAVLNAMLAEGKIDVAPSSSFEYAVHDDRYLLLPGLSISSIGEVKSVLLFSHVPIEKLDNCSIGLTSESATSVALLNILLTEFMGFSNRYERTDMLYEEALGKYDALLLIGDAALRASLKSRGAYVYDLGQQWHKFCGLPFVFALWIVRRDAWVSRKDEVLSLLRDLSAAKDIASREYEAIADDCDGLSWFGHDDLITYWNTISYGLTAEHLKGLNLFYLHAVQLGMLTHTPGIRFVE